MDTIGGVLSFLRQKAEKHRLAAERYEAAAAATEAAFNAGYDADEASANCAAVATPDDAPTAPTVADLANYLSWSAKRMPEIAAHFGVAEDAIDTLLTEENGFYRGLQGWWTYRKPNDNGLVQS